MQEKERDESGNKFIWIFAYILKKISIISFDMKINL